MSEPTNKPSVIYVEGEGATFLENSQKMKHLGEDVMIVRH